MRELFYVWDTYDINGYMFAFQMCQTVTGVLVC